MYVEKLYFWVDQNSRAMPYKAPPKRVKQRFKRRAHKVMPYLPGVDLKLIPHAHLFQLFMYKVCEGKEDR